MPELLRPAVSHRGIVRPTLGVLGTSSSDPRQVGTAALVAAVAAAGAAATFGTIAIPVLAAAALAAVLLRYPPVLLAAFLFVPWFKSLPLLAQAPVDPTTALTGLLFAVCTYRLIRGRYRKIPLGFIAPVLLVGVALAIGLLWTIQPDYGQEKVVKYFTVTLLAAVAPFFVLRTNGELIAFGIAIAGAGIVVAAMTPFSQARVIPGITTETSLQGRFSFGGQIFPSRFLCTAALILLFLPAFTRTRLRYLGPPLALGVIAVALGIGSRGPVLALGVAVATVAALSVLSSPRQLALVLSSLLVSLAAFPFITLPDTAHERIGTAVTDPVTVFEGDDRSMLYSKAIDLVGDNPLIGAGTGSYAAYSTTLGQYGILYPHNLLLELASEVGVFPALVALFPVVVGVALLLRRARATTSRRKRQLLHLVLGLFMVAFLSAQFSGDINNNRSLWTFLGVVWLFARSDVISPRSVQVAGTGPER